MVFNGKQETEYLCEDGIEKCVPRDYSTSPVTPNCDLRDGLFYPTLILMIDSYRFGPE